MGCGGSKDAIGVWESLDKMIPYQKMQEPTNRRAAAWKYFDRRHVGHLSEDDCYMGCKDHLKIGGLCRPAETLNIANKEAYKASHKLRTRDPCTDEVDPAEFRIYLSYLRKYIEMAHLFLTHSNNKKPDPVTNEYTIEKDGFIKLIPKLSKLGKFVTSEPAKVFAELDKDGSGKISFAHLCQWTREADQSQTEEFMKEAEEHVEHVQKKLERPDDRAKIWTEIRPRFPLDDSHREALKRDQLFSQFDSSNKGLISESDCLNSCIDHLNLLQLLDQAQLAEFNKRSFANAKRLRENNGTSGVIDRAEFKVYLDTLRGILDMYFYFKVSGNPKAAVISKNDYKEAMNLLAKHGGVIPDEKAWEKHDTDNTNKLPFYEVCSILEDATLKQQQEVMQKMAQNARNASELASKCTEKEFEEERVAAKDRKQLWDDELKIRLPREKSREQNKERTRIFRKFDVKKNRAITYEEFEAGCREILNLTQFYEPLAPILMRAYDHAAHARPLEQKRGGLIRIERIEFRIALVFIYDYMELFVRFEEFGLSTKRRITLEIFKEICPIMGSWGIKISDKVAAFNDVDLAGVSTVSFDEMADWAIFKHMQSQKVDVFQRRRSSVSSIGSGDEM